MVDISVITPLHQGADTIVETLDSLQRARGDASLEVIVVDDRSTDGGPALARSHPLRPLVLESRAPGASAARNAGLARATGDFVAFLDADDLLLPGALPRRLEVARRLPPRTLLATRHLELRDGALRPMTLVRLPLEDQRLAQLTWNQFQINAALVPRALLGAAPFLEDVRAGNEDWALWLRLALEGARYELLDVEDCVWRLRPGTLSQESRFRCTDGLRVLDHARAWIEACPAADRPALRRRWRRTRHAWLRRRALLALRERDLAAAMRDVGAAVVASPFDGLTLPLRGARRAVRRALGLANP